MTIFVTPQGTACTSKYAAMVAARFQSQRVSLPVLPKLVIPPTSGSPAAPAQVAGSSI